MGRGQRRHTNRPGFAWPIQEYSHSQCPSLPRQSTFCPGIFLSKICCNKSSAVAEMGDRGHNRHGPKRWGAAVPLSRRAGTPSNTMWPGPMSTSVPSGVFIHPVVWPQRTWAKTGGLCPFSRGEAGSPSNTKSPGLKPTSIPSGILMHPAVWPQ